MNTVDVITRKRDGSALNAEEIRYMVDGYTAGDIPDYQMSAFLMAVYFQGMNEEETILLTKYMKESGDTVDLSGIRGIKVDKHSTGGVGDKTTLIAGPAAAACGVPVDEAWALPAGLSINWERSRDFRRRSRNRILSIRSMRKASQSSVRRDISHRQTKRSTRCVTLQQRWII